MPYMIKTKGLFLQMRDGRGGEMRPVGHEAFVRFDHLPPGLTPNGDHQIIVQAIGDEPGADQMFNEIVKHEEPKAVKEKPHKRKKSRE